MTPPPTRWKKWTPDELEALLREAVPEQAAALIAAMEPDEAVDALRDLSDSERDLILKHLPAEKTAELSALLTYRRTPPAVS